MEARPQRVWRSAVAEGDPLQRLVRPGRGRGLVYVRGVGLHGFVSVVEQIRYDLEGSEPYGPTSIVPSGAFEPQGKLLLRGSQRY